MMAILDQVLFEGGHGVYETTLVALVQLGFEGRHVIRTDPEYDVSEGSQPIMRWLAAQSAELAREIHQALDDGLRRAAERECDCVMVRPGRSDRSRRPQLLAPDDALRLMRTPVKLLLENRRNDLAFLLRMLPPDWAVRFRAALAEGWAEAIQGGGLSEARLAVETIVPDSVDAMRYFAVFDSDALAPGQRGAEANRMITACEVAGVRFHCLTRRESENYLPRAALWRWANPNPDRRRRLETFLGLPADERHHDDLKTRFAGNILAQFAREGFDDFWMDDEHAYDAALRPERLRLAQMLSTTSPRRARCGARDVPWA